MLTSCGRQRELLFEILYNPAFLSALPVKAQPASGMSTNGAEATRESSADRVGLEECLQLLRGPSDERR